MIDFSGSSTLRKKPGKPAKEAIKLPARFAGSSYWHRTTEEATKSAIRMVAKILPDSMPIRLEFRTTESYCRASDSSQSLSKAY